MHVIETGWHGRMLRRLGACVLAAAAAAGTVFATEPPLPAIPAPAASALPERLQAGDYACRRHESAAGSVKLERDGRYRWQRGSGEYRYNASAGTVDWLSGPLAAEKLVRTRYRWSDQTGEPELELQPVEGIVWSCTLQR